MDGITILSEKAIEISAISSEWWIIWMVIGAVALVWLGAIAFADSDTEALVCGVLICVLCLVIGALRFPREAESYVTYKVTVDETVSMTEFYDEYKIIDQEGLIFTVSERE